MNTRRDGRDRKHLRIYCKDCQKKVTLNNKQQKAEQFLKNHLERKSYRILEDEYGLEKKTICAYTNKAASQLIHSNDLTKLLTPQNYCGVILVDGKWVSVKKPEEKKALQTTKGQLVCIPFIDYLTHDHPVHVMASSENSYELAEGFRILKEIGYPLKVVVCDEAMMDKVQIARKYFPDVIIQICLIHYDRSIDRAFKVNSVRRHIRSLQKKLDFMGDSFLISTHQNDARKARKIVNEIADLEYQYGYLLEMQNIFKDIFWKAKTIEELEELEDELNVAIGRMNLRHYPYQKIIRDRYKDYYEKREHLLAYLNHPDLDIPKTTNLIEGFNSTTLEIRFSSIRGFEYEETAKGYINALILKRRFQKFKDCKGKFKHLNGRCPLEIAQPKYTHNFNFRDDDWIQFCKFLKLKPPK